MCAGCEGDDWYARIAVGDTVSWQQVTAVLDCLAVGAWMLDEQEAHRVEKVEAPK